MHTTYVSKNAGAIAVFHDENATTIFGLNLGACDGDSDYLPRQRHGDCVNLPGRRHGRFCLKGHIILAQGFNLGKRIGK